uniref:Thyroglobulin type-1 domain-containing protein n=1 Tax=Sinocyclocheilus grahami TaxID=75366 RepID=A0A672QS22_SINGR
LYDTLHIKRVTHLYTYIPSCDEDGFYRRLQCDKSRGECWCVDQHGGEQLYLLYSVKNHVDCCVCNNQIHHGYKTTCYLDMKLSHI